MEFEKRIELLDRIIGKSANPITGDRYNVEIRKHLSELNELVFKGRKPAEVGDIRDWSSGKIIKTPQGWKPYKEGDEEEYGKEEVDDDGSEQEIMDLQTEADELVEDMDIDNIEDIDDIDFEEDGGSVVDFEEEVEFAHSELLGSGSIPEEELNSMSDEEILEAYNSYISTDEETYDSEDYKNELRNMSVEEVLDKKVEDLTSEDIDFMVGEFEYYGVEMAGVDDDEVILQSYQDMLRDEAGDSDDPYTNVQEETDRTPDELKEFDKE